MMRKAIFILLYFTLATASWAALSDSIRVTGRVSYANGDAAYAIVAALHPTDSSLIAYCITDDEGNYNLHFTTEANNILVRLSGFNVKRKIRKVKAVSQSLDFTAEETSITLREANVKAQKLWGSRDTINYLVASYMTNYDRTIGDVLKQLPGITIEGGTIKYQGTPINNFYVEDMDMLQGRYNIITDALKAEDVATVQVLENHEHIKSLQDQIRPDAASINLKLKTKSKGIWTKAVALGAGYDNGMLWNCEGNAMYFGKQRQHIIYYGADNTGKGADRMLQHYGSSKLGTITLTDIIYPGTSPVGSTLWNNEHAFHSSNLNRLSKTAQLHYSLTYNHDIQKQESYSQTTYLLPGSNFRVVSEDISSHLTTNNSFVRLSYENNAQRNYLSNTLDLSGQWRDANGVVVSNTKEMQQHGFNRNIGVSNYTRWVHRTEGGNGVEMTSYNSAQTNAQSLTVCGGLDARQDIDLTRVSTVNEFSLIKDLRKHRWSIVPTAALKLNYVGMKPLLQSAISPDNGDMHYLRAGVNTSATLKYVNNDFILSFRLPLALTHTQIKDETHRTRLCFTPLFNLQWKINDSWTIASGGSYGVQPTSWPQLISTYIMSNYRTTSRYLPSISDSHMGSVSSKLSFKDIMNSLFVYIQGKASRSWSDVIYGTTIDNDARTIMQAEYMPHHDDSYSTTGNVSKGFDWKKARIDITANYSHHYGSILRQAVKTDYHNNNFSFNVNTSADILQNFRISYDCSYAFSRSVSGDYAHKIRTLEQSLNLNLSLIRKSLLMNITARHTHNSGLQEKTDYAFLNCSLTYRTKRKIEFILEGNNIFNTHTFISRSDTQLTQYFEIYQLRPRSIMLTARFNL